MYPPFVSYNTNKKIDNLSRTQIQYIVRGWDIFFLNFSYSNLCLSQVGLLYSFPWNFLSGTWHVLQLFSLAMINPIIPNQILSVAKSEEII